MESFQKYINSLPEPLTKEEQRALIRNYYVTKNDEIRELLITHNLRLVADIVLGFVGKGDLDDLMQIGTMELMLDLDKYNPTRGAEFSTFAYASIRGRLENATNMERRSRDVLYQSTTSTLENFEEDEATDIFDFVAYYDNFVREIAEKDNFEKALNLLNEMERYFIVHELGLFGYEKLSINTMCEYWGIGIDSGYMYLNKAKEKLRDYYLKDSGIVVEESEEVKLARKVLNETLNPNYRFVIEHYYGLNGKEKLTGVEISKRLGKNIHYASGVISAMFSNRGIEREKTVTVEEVVDFIQRSKNSKEIAVLEYRYGLNGKPQLSNAEIAEILKEKKTTIDTIMVRFKRKIAKNRQLQLFGS